MRARDAGATALKKITRGSRVSLRMIDRLVSRYIWSLTIQLIMDYKKRHPWIYMYAPWLLLRLARTGSFATLCSAGRECRCWHGRLIPESRAHGPCSSNDRRCRGLQRRLCSDWWRPFAPNPRGTTESLALDSRLRRTVGSPWRRNVFPRRAAGVEIAGRLRKFNFNPPIGSACAKMNSRGGEKKNVTSLLPPRVYSARGLFRERVSTTRRSIFYIVTAIAPLTRL